MSLPPPPAELAGGRLRLRSLHLFSLHLGVALQAGLSLLGALKAAQGGEDRRLVATAAYLRACVAQGFPLSRAMQALPTFPPLYVQLVKCAEETGALARIFPRLADHLEQQGHIWRKATSSLLYPACLGCFTVGITALLKLYMLPRLLELGGLKGGELPLLTRVVAAPIPWFVPALALLLAISLGAHLQMRWRNPEGRLALEERLFSLPGLGPAAYGLLWGEMARALATMVGSGMPLLRAVQTLGQSAGPSRRIDRALAEVAHSLKTGRTVSQAFEEQAAVPRLLAIMMRVADTTGTLPRTMGHYAELQEMVWEIRLEVALKLVEPLLLAISGLVVGLTLLAAFLPIYGLASQL